MYEIELPGAGSTDDEEFVVNRLGQDPGIHVCGNDVVMILSVANETSAPITLSKLDGTDLGFEGSAMKSLKILPGVSAKFPLLLPRLERAPDICDRLTSMTRLQWQADVSEVGFNAEGATGGPMVPINRRVRGGILEIPSVCLKNIIDENPIFLSRVCKAPCFISVNLPGLNSTASSSEVETGKAVDVAVGVDLASWLSHGLMEKTNLTLEFCCARKNSSDSEAPEKRDWIWIGHVRKALISGERSKGPHLARLLFFNEGDYVVSACVSFSRLGNDNDVKEVWWA
eukprot:CAMPEP_0178811666 /NCGR_PEP_ID=MMETSP0745-20121128/19408_1 /TAXON_ID=913974 /ORGANISM="Nitzschia punctata, Strain CCMP561" /LENGTH=284 /DNA_ID=CAMNT_0020472395 /DNA_START=315 /DNA_END=1166 /DNA_ORIENTATION=-